MSYLLFVIFLEGLLTLCSGHAELFLVILKQGFVFQCGVKVHNREDLAALSVTKRTLSPCSYERLLLYFYISL